MQPATTRTMASVGASIVGSGTSVRRMSPGAWIVVARMGPSLSCRWPDPKPRTSNPGRQSLDVKADVPSRSAAGAQAQVGQAGGGEGVVPGVGEGAVARAGCRGGIRPLLARRPLALPVLAEADDLVVAAADEVPPHDDLLAEGCAAEDEEARGPVRAGLDGDAAGAGGHEGDLARFGGDVADREHACVAEQSVLVLRVHVDVEGGPGGERHLGADEVGEH